MIIKNIMNKNIESIKPTTTIFETAKIMRNMKTGFIPVCDDNRKVKGVITDRDITIRAIAEGVSEKDKIEKILTNHVQTCFQDEDLSVAAEKMKKNHILRLAVLDNKTDQKLVGVLSLSDFMKHNEAKIGAQIAESVYKTIN